MGREVNEEEIKDIQKKMEELDDPDILNMLCNDIQIDGFPIFEYEYWNASPSKTTYFVCQKLLADIDMCSYEYLDYSDIPTPHNEKYKIILLDTS